MIYLWILELILMIGLVLYSIMQSELLNALLRKTENIIHTSVHDWGSTHLATLHQALGHGRLEFEEWWSKNWLQFKILTAVSLILGFCLHHLLWFVLPFLWMGWTYSRLIKDVRIRKDRILKRIPFVLDMLILNLKSGLDFVSSLEELIQMNDAHPLHDEIRFTLQSIHIGEPRSSAFRNLGTRTQVPELSNLASVIEQSETMGSSLIELLSLQSEEIRHRIFKRAEAEAQKAPVKILVPMLMCIFPVVFIVLFVPIAIQVMDVLR